MAETHTELNLQESEEWLEALEDVLENRGAAYTQKLLDKTVQRWQQLGGAPCGGGNTPYRNTLTVADEDSLAGQEDNQKAFHITLWNAMCMVVRAGKVGSELGGHISTYASIGQLYQVGLDYFFRGPDHPQGQDLIYYQGHSAPGIYARSHLEGRLTDQHLEWFRQETQAGEGLSSYPHPWLMPEYWQFPTVSMGLGPLQAIYQARWLRYLADRGIQDTRARTVWAFCGDGEMDEPESLGALSMPVREKLDNLVMVVNCNLQRLDGPVRGNGKIVQELERVFAGAGWRVLKCLWNHAWDRLLQDDHQGRLQNALDQLVDGQYQNLISQGPHALLQYLGQQDSQLAQQLAQYPDDLIAQLAPGGHDPVKIYAVYKKALAREGKPVVILAHTIKGYGLGPGVTAANTTHQQKKLKAEAMVAYGKSLGIPLSEEALATPEYYHPGQDSPICQHIARNRAQLGGSIPKRHFDRKSIPAPAPEVFTELYQDTGDRAISTTMAFVRGLSALLKQPQLRDAIVPIVPDESRTFGMEGLFRQIGIYASQGQTYEPVDRSQIMYYREAKDGQLLQEGINEAGAVCSWIAAATSYATCNTPMIPFYIYYSMFGFQRVGDLLWAAGDMRARGFLLGATAGRTTLAGEGLQHNDGHSHVMSSVIPNCKSYDPCFHYELAVIMREGMKEMVEQGKDVFYYITLMNENYHHPAIPEGVEAGIIKGMYTQKAWQDEASVIHLLGSGPIVGEVLKAQELLRAAGIASCVWSVTSFTELAREGLAWERADTFSETTGQAPECWVASNLADGKPVIAATDYVKAYAEQIRPYVPGSYQVLGTDGYGRSDTRKALRAFFGVNAQSIAWAAVKKLVSLGVVAEAQLASFRLPNSKELQQDPLGL